MDPIALRDKIVEKAREFGADDAGVCLAADLLEGPTHQKFALPEGVKKDHFILVFGLNHPEDQPALDHFIKKSGFRFGNSEGNRRLMKISDLLGQWFLEEKIASRDLHYYVERGGVFLKGAAVLAGLGTIGLNNLLIHPGYSTRIRFRARLIDIPLAASEPLVFKPCEGCERPCLDSCPERAFGKYGYDTLKCQVRLDRDFEEGFPVYASDGSVTAVEAHCCRICEFACSYKGTMERNV